MCGKERIMNYQNYIYIYIDTGGLYALISVFGRKRTIEMGNCRGSSLACCVLLLSLLVGGESLAPENKVINEKYVRLLHAYVNGN